VGWVVVDGAWKVQGRFRGCVVRLVFGRGVAWGGRDGGEWGVQWGGQGFPWDGGRGRGWSGLQVGGCVFFALLRGWCTGSDWWMAWGKRITFGYGTGGTVRKLGVR